MENSAEEEVIREYHLLRLLGNLFLFLLVLISILFSFSGGSCFFIILSLVLNLLISLFLHIVKHSNHTRSTFPSKFTHNSGFNFPEMTDHPLRHIRVQFQEDVKNSPKIERRLVNNLNHGVYLHVLDILHEKLQLTCANNNRL